MTGTELISAHPAEWSAATRHKFLDAVRRGSLPAASFRVWLEQDYHFLSDLLDFQQDLLDHSPASARPTLQAGLSAIEAELEWFKQTATDSDFMLNADRLQTTEAYQSHLVSMGNIWSTAITALWVGERAYLEAWQSALPVAHGRYRQFVEHWTSPEFVAYVKQLELILGSEGDEEAFVSTCRMEAAFWDMVWATAKS